MVTKFLAAALSAALVLGTASATFAASKNKKQPAPRAATVTTAPQPDNAYHSYASGQTPTQSVRVAIPEPAYFTHATGHQDDAD